MTYRTHRKRTAIHQQNRTHTIGQKSAMRSQYHTGRLKSNKNSLALPPQEPEEQAITCNLSLQTNDHARNTVTQCTCICKRCQLASLVERGPFTKHRVHGRKRNTLNIAATTCLNNNYYDKHAYRIYNRVYGKLISRLAYISVDL